MSNKYKIWWRPNFLDNDFEHKCSSVLEGYIALEVCSFLDLPNAYSLIPNLVELYPNHKSHIERVSGRYKKYRRENSINAEYLIEDNMGGLLTEEDGEWVDWTDPDYGEDIHTFVSMFCNDLYADVEEELSKFN